jgi:beta-N-acetylhexosaminidase
MKPVIFGCAGPTLSDVERRFFSEVQPAGFILFGRNILSPIQLSALTTDLRVAVDRPNIPILIDQEGGRVQRMKAPHWRHYPPMAFFGAAAIHNPELALRALELNCKMIADDLRRVGINTNCMPLLDVPIETADTIIGDRAFSSNAKLVYQMGQLVIEAFLLAGIAPVAKHLPGHGRALVDSHNMLPIVSALKEDLVETDFAACKAAHVVYDAIDPSMPATLSRDIIQSVIRGTAGFSGLLMTDDLSMKALSGSIGALANASIQAGCDLVLHCNGDMAEMQDVAAALDEAPSKLEIKLNKIIKDATSRPHTDRAVLEAVYDASIAQIKTLK